MWQKLNQLDIIKLERARIQLINVLQLVSAAPRSFGKQLKDKKIDWLRWEVEDSSLVSNKFGKNRDILIALDIERFILSIIGPQNQKEHLVLSGMTYPMAYGWMKIKLENFGLSGNDFDDGAEYTLEHYLKPSEEINTSDQHTYEHLPIYFSNAHYLLLEFMKQNGISGDILIEPSTANMALLTNNSSVPSIGFSLGNRSFPEPYFYLQLAENPSQRSPEAFELDGIWNGKNNELVLMSSDFITQNQDLEYKKVMNFFISNYSKLVES